MTRHKIKKIVAQTLIGLLCVQSIAPATAYASSGVSVNKEIKEEVIEEITDEITNQITEEQGISIKQLPDKTIYIKDQDIELDATGLVIEVVRDSLNGDGSLEKELVTYDGSNMELAINRDLQEDSTKQEWYQVEGIHYVTVTYEAYTAEYEIEIVEEKDEAPEIEFGEFVSYRVSSTKPAYYVFNTRAAGVHYITRGSSDERINIYQIDGDYKEQLQAINYTNTYWDDNDCYNEFYNLEANTKYLVEIRGAHSYDQWGEFQVRGESVSQIDINTMPNQIIYYKDSSSTISLEGLVLAVDYTDGDSGLISYGEVKDIGYKDICELDFEGHEEHDESSFMEHIGNHQIGIQYRGATTQITVTVIEDPVAEVSVKKTPDKTSYYTVLDQQIDLEGLEFEITMKDGTSKVVSEDDPLIEYLGVYETQEDLVNENEIYGWFEMEGTYLVGIRYGSKILSFEITVENPNVTGIKMIHAPHKMVYTQYETGDIDLSGIELEVYQEEKVIGIVTEEQIRGMSYSPSDWYEKVGTYSFRLSVAGTEFLLEGIQVVSIVDKFSEVEDTLLLNEEVELYFHEIGGSKIYRVTPTKTTDYIFRINFESEGWGFQSPYLLDQSGTQIGDKIGNNKDELCYVSLAQGQTYYYVVNFPNNDSGSVSFAWREGTLKSFDYVSGSMKNSIMQNLYNEVDMYGANFRITNTDHSTIICGYDEERMDWEFASKVDANWANTPGKYKIQVTYKDKIATYPFEVVSIQDFTKGMDTIVEGETYEVPDTNSTSMNYVRFIPQVTGIYELKTNVYPSFEYFLNSQGRSIIELSSEWPGEEYYSVFAELQQGEEYYISADSGNFFINLFDTSDIEAITLSDREVTYDYFQYRDTDLMKYMLYVDVKIKGREDSVYVVMSPAAVNVSREDWYNQAGNHTVTLGLLNQQFSYPITVIDSKEYFNSAVEVTEGIPMKAEMLEYKREGYFYKFIPTETAYYKSEVNDLPYARVGGWIFDEEGNLVAKNDPYAVAKLEKGKTYYINVKRNETDSDYSLLITRLESSNLEAASFNVRPEYKLSSIDTQSYTGQKVEPKLELTKKGVRLVEDVDYSVRYYDNVKPGKANVVVQISPEGEDGITMIQSFGIESSDSESSVMEFGEAKLDTTTYGYTGNVIAPKPIIRNASNVILIENVDYTLSYSNDCINAGQKTINITGIGNYKGTKVLTYEIEQAEISQASSSTIEAQSYTGNAIVPKPVIRNASNATLTENIDYMLSYSNDCINVGEKTIIVTGKGNYKGTKTIFYTIKQAELSQTVISNIRAYTYIGKAITPAITVTNGITVLSEGIDYVVEYSNNITKGTATVTITGRGNFVGTVQKAFTINAKSLSNVTISKISNVVYTGKNVTPKATIKDGTVTLRFNKDYTVAYKNNKNIGDATVVITGKGNYAGSRTVKFTIVPKTTASVKTSSKKTKEVTVTWAKDKQVTGYEIVYATDSKLKKNKKTITVKKNGTTSYSLKKLKKNQKYYVSMRSYKTVNGKKSYSSASKVVSVKCK